MATSGSLTTSYCKNLCMMLSWTSTQSVADNKSTISWTLKGYRTDGATGYITCGGFKIVIDGVTVYSKSTDYRVDVRNGDVVASGTTTIAHKADGSKSFTIDLEAAIYYYAVNCSGSKSFDLPTIARASVPTVSATSVKMLEPVTITTNRKSTAFTHDLTYSFGGSTGTIATGVADSYKWTVPDLVSKISGKATGTCTITCTTKNGSSVVGRNTVSLTLQIPVSSSPTVSATTVQMGKSVTIKTNQKSTGYTHTIIYVLEGTPTTETIGTGVGESIVWTPPKSLAAKTLGKTSVTCSILCETYNGSWFVGSRATKFTLTVPNATVPTLSASTVAMGSEITISLPEEADVYTHRLTYSLSKFGTSTVVTSGSIGNYAGGSLEWEVPLSFATEIPADTKATVTITCQTLLGSTEVGTKSTSFTATMPNNTTTQPKLTMSFTPVHSLPSAFNGIYVQGKSNVKVSLTATSDHSTIASYLTEMPGARSNVNPFTSALLNSSGTVTIKGTAKDARGYSTTTEGSIEVIPYGRPRIIPGQGKKSIVCERCNSDGKADPGGVYLLIQIGRQYHKVVSGGVQKNYCKLSYRWKTDAESDAYYSAPVELLATTATSDYVSVILPDIVSSNTTAYNIQLMAEDDIGETDSVTVTIPTAFVTFHVPAGGHGLTLGGYHDPDKYDVFDCVFDAEFEGNVSGRVYGLGGLPMIPEGADFNTYKEFGIYAVTQNAKAETITNMPVQKAGVLRVWSANGLGLLTGSYVYMLQEFIVYDNSATYRRSMMLENDSWKYGAWKVVDGVDAIIDQGSTDGWYWRKFADGTAECWTRVTQTVNVSTVWGVLYYGACKVVQFPFAFAYAPTCNIHAEYAAAGNPSAMLASNGRSTTTQAANVLLVRPTANTAVDCVVVYHAIGRWK